MNDQERQLIESLAARIRNAPAPEINAEADELIRRTVGSIPNALYILTQTVLLQELALNQTKSQNAPSFLSSAQSGNWGRDGRLPQQERPDRPPANQYTGGGYRGSAYQTGVSPVPQPPPPPLETAQGGWFAQPPSRTSSFLQSAAQTAAGVVAGEMAFSALSSLFGGFGHHQGGFLGGGGWGGGGVHETIINNNYFDESPSHHHDTSSDDRDSLLSDTSDQYDDTSFDDGSDTIDI